MAFLQLSNETISNNRDLISISYYQYYPVFGYLMLTLGIIGVINCMMCLIFILLYLNHKLIMATCSFISIIIIIALLLGNIPLFLAAIARPSPIVCTLIPALYGLCYGIVYSSLFIKILRLIRVWHNAMEGIRNAKFIGKNAVALQAIILATFLVQYNYPY